MPNQFSLAGANPGKQTKFAPLYNPRWSSGIWTNRSPLRDANTTRVNEKYYGASGDALIAGSNVEITNKLTLARRPGNTPFLADSTQLVESVDRFYEFRTFNSNTEQIIVMIDQANALYALTNLNTISLVWSKSGGTEFVPISGGPSKPVGISPRIAAPVTIATTTNTLSTTSAKVFPANGAGQSFMQSVGNTLYWGDGVSNKKWLQSLTQWNAGSNWNTSTTPYLSTFLIDTNGNIQQLTGAAIQLTSVYASGSQILVTTTPDIASVVNVGDKLTFPNKMAATFLAGQTVTILAMSPVGGANGGANGYFTAYFNSVVYAQANESGYATAFPGDGTPTSGSVPPMWSLTVPSSLNNFQGGITIDGSVQWTNRGNPVENWGIQPPTGMLKPTVNSTYGVYESNTYYSVPGVVIDSNGNLQQVTKSGLSGAADPQWSTVLGGMTYENGTAGITWTMIASAGQMQWTANTFFPTGSFIIASASGTNCLFELGSSTAPYISGQVSAYIYPGNPSEYGVFVQSYPTALGDAQASYNALTGFNFTGVPLPSGASLSWDIIDSSGATKGQVNPFPGFTQDYDMVIMATLQVPVAGQYTMVNAHHDGCIMGIGGGAQTISATSNNPTGQTLTAVGGFPIVGGTNQRFEGGLNVTDTFVVDFPTAGTYPIEFDFAYWFHSGLQLHFTCNGNVIASGQPSGGGTTQAAPPIWPPFTTSDAPAYASVTESQGQLQWNNMGPAGDFTWFPNITYTLPDSTIVDGNSDQEAPFRTGHTSTVPPTFNTTLYSITTDPSPPLTWINQGGVSIPPVGTVSTFNGGWVYAVSLVNTLDDTVSNATPISAATGNFTGAFGVVIPPGSGLDVSKIDPQADYVAIWRSTDGFTSPFLIPGPNDFALPITIPLSQYLTLGFVDTTPDVGLNNLISAPILGENTPPGPGAINLCYYLGRLFYSIGNTVYWTSGPDTPAGNGLNGSAGDNFDEQIALVKRLVPNTKGLLVFTVSDINIIGGSGQANDPIQSSVPLLEGIGLSSYNALDTKGSVIGFFTTDNQFVAIDPANGVSIASFPIADQMRLSNGQPGQNWNPASVYVTHHTSGEDQGWFVSDGQYGWYRLIDTPAPESGYTWAPFATIQGGCKCVQSVEVKPGVHKLLLGPVGLGKILARDVDSSLDGTIPYPASAVIGSMVLAQPGQIAIVSFITAESVNVGTPLALGILVDEALPYFQGPFEILKHWKPDTPTLLPSLSILGQRFYVDELIDYVAAMRHCQVQVTWAAEDAANELLSLTVFGGFVQDN